MEKLVPFTINDLAKVTNFRSGEVKFGEKMLTVPKNTDANEYLNSCDAKYVLFGIPEDIGVRANYGRTGAATAWESAIKSIANIQHNRFCKGSQLLVLGQLNVSEEIGIELTESLAMYPASSVCGWYFSHPESKYFGVGKITKDQLVDYAERKAMNIEEAEKWLRPVLE